MVAYYFSFKTALVKGSPNVVAANTSVLIYDVTDVNRATPVTAYTDAGLTTIANLVSDAYGIIPDFYTNNRPDVLWKSGTLKGQWATSQSRPGLPGPTGPEGPQGIQGVQGNPGLNGAGTNAAVAAYIPVAGPVRDALDADYQNKAALDADVAAKVNTPASGTRVALDGRYAKASTVGAPSGIATLDSSGKVPAAQLPNLTTVLKAVDTVPVIVYGDSYTTATGATDAAHGFPTRFAKSVNANITTLFGKSATTLGQTVAGMVGDANFPGIGWFIGNRGVVVLKSVINSVINITAAQDAQEKIGYQQHLRTFLRIIRAGAWIPETDASCVYTGTWSNATVSKTNGGVAKKTSTNGDKVTITTTASEIAIMLLGFPTAAGTSFTITVNGLPYTPEHTNTGLTTTMATDALAWFPISIRVAGLTGTSTVVLTNTSATAAGDLYFDGYLTKSATPPPVIVCKEATPTVAGLQINGAATNRTAANLAVFNGYIDTICGSAEFNDGLVVVADPGPNYNNTTMENTASRPHPNNIGHAVYSYAVQQAANKLGFSTGLNL